MNIRLLLPLLILSIVISGCGKQQKKEQHIKKIEIVSPMEPENQSYVHDKAKKGFSGERNDIVLDVKKLTSHESKKLFGHDFASYGYQPVKLSIMNKTCGELLLRASAISLALVDMVDVALSAHYNMALWSIVPATWLSAIFFWPALVPTIGAWVWMEKENRRINRAVYEEILESEESAMILPHERFERIFFVASEEFESNGTFLISLYDVEKKGFVPFNVSIDKSI